MATILRPYQVEDTDAICNAIDNGYNRVGIEDATGLGKSTIIAEVVKRRLALGRCVLVNVDRIEIVEDLYARILNYCELKNTFGNIQIAMEMDKFHAPVGCKVVVASIQSLSEARLDALLARFHPNDIITDEADRAAAPQNQRLYRTAGVYEGKATHVAVSATMERADGKFLYAIDEFDKPVTLLKGKQEKEVVAKREDCVLEKLLVRRDYVWGVDNGYLVDAIFWGFETDTDVGDLPLKADGDFQDDAYAKRVDNAKRTLCIINGWMNTCPERQTIAFCASVEHAHHTAQLWREAGYTAECVDAKTPKDVREDRFRRFKAGKLQILTNFSVIEKGHDFPKCSCICFLKQSKLRKYVKQCLGRGLRVLPNVVDTDELRPAENIEGRIAAIAASAKIDCYVLDAVDIGSVDVKRPQELVGLPSNMTMQGESLIKTKKKIDEFCKQTGRDIADCPLNFAEVEIILKRSLHYQSLKINRKLWEPAAHGYTFSNAMPGYSASILCSDNGNRLVIKHGDKAISDWPVPPDKSLSEDIMKKAASHAFKMIREHNSKYREENPIVVNRGTSNKLSEKQLQFLLRHCKPAVTREQIDEWPLGKAKAIIGSISAKWNKAKETAQ